MTAAAEPLMHDLLLCRGPVERIFNFIKSPLSALCLSLTKGKFIITMYIPSVPIAKAWITKVFSLIGGKSRIATKNKHYLARQKLLWASLHFNKSKIFTFALSIFHADHLQIMLTICGCFHPSWINYLGAYVNNMNLLYHFCHGLFWHISSHLGNFILIWPLPLPLLIS